MMHHNAKSQSAIWGQPSTSHFYPHYHTTSIVPGTNISPIKEYKLLPDPYSRSKAQNVYQFLNNTSLPKQGGYPSKPREQDYSSSPSKYSEVPQRIDYSSAQKSLNPRSAATDYQPHPLGEYSSNKSKIFMAERISLLDKHDARALLQDNNHSHIEKILQLVEFDGFQDPQQLIHSIDKAQQILEQLKQLAKAKLKPQTTEEHNLVSEVIRQDIQTYLQDLYDKVEYPKID